MKRLWTLAVVVLAACGAPASRSAPPSGALEPASPAAPAPASTPSPGPTSAMVDAPPAPPRAAYAPPAPFTIVARAPGELVFDVFPSGGGEAWIAAAPVDGKRAPTWARTRVATIERLGERSKGLPPGIALMESGAPAAAPRITHASSVGDAAWLAIARPENKGVRCEVFEWKGETWTARGTGATPGPCTRLAAWTPGTALATVDEGPLVAFGAPPKVMPAVGTGPGGTCLAGRIDALEAWDSGEVVAVGIGCGVPTVWVQRWSARTRLPVMFRAEVDGNGPYFVNIVSRDEIGISGGGILPDEPNVEVAIHDRVRFANGRFTESKTAEGTSHFVGMMVNGPGLVGATRDVKEDGVTFGGYRIVGGDIYASVTVIEQRKAIETLLLRDRPVATPYVFAP